MTYMSAKIDEEAHNSLVSCVHKLITIYVYCDLDFWPLTWKFNRAHSLTMASMSIKFDEETQRFSLYRVHKFISVYVNCDLELWPLTSKIKRVHLLAIVNMSAMFDEDVHNSLVAIAFTRIRCDGLTDWLTDGRTHGVMEPWQHYYIPYPTRCSGIIKIPGSPP